MYISVGNLDVSSLDNIDSHRKQLLEDLDWLFDKICGDAEMNDVRPLPQLHTLVWGNRRGV
ncbi:7-carboxy-7-deazaguanine synthase [compost metagenome]